MAIKFKPGDVFKLQPKARVTWLTFAVYGPDSSAIRACRCDSPLGMELLAWIAAGKPKEHPCRTDVVRAMFTEFYEHQLESAVLEREATICNQ